MSQAVNTSTETDSKYEKLLKVCVHDLSNPLLVMGLHIQNLKKAADLKRVLEITLKLEHQEQLMRNLLQKVNKMAFSAGSSQVKLNSMHLKKLLADVLKNFENEAQAKSVLFETVDSVHKANVSGDRTLLESVIFKNIFQNAIKFSVPGNTIQIKISSDHERLSLITIENICPAEKAEMFQKMWTQQNISSTPGTQGELGTGFGLDLVQHFLSLMGGSLEFNFEAIDADYSRVRAVIGLEAC